MKPFRCQPTSPGMGLVWADPPPGVESGPGAGNAVRAEPSPAESRWAALWKAGQTHSESPATGADGEGRCGEDGGPWREARLVGPCHDTARWGQAMAWLRHDHPDILLRVEEVWGGEAPSFLPAEMLAAQAPLFVHGIVQRPEQITDELARRLRSLAAAGLPLAAEIPLQCGVNDNVEVLRELCLTLIRHGVRPYYLVDGEWMAPARRVAKARSEELVRGLRGWISGLAVPQLVVEDCGGVRRPVVPDYLEGLDEEGARGKDYKRQRFAYPNPPARRSGTASHKE